MLVSALGATLVGFVLLVLALATGTLWLAVACIVICVVGALLLLADTLGLRPRLPRRVRATASSGDADAAVPPDDDAPTEQFDRITDDTVVTLGDDEPATDDEPVTDDESATGGEPRDTDPVAEPSRHGRHERPDVDDDVVDPTGDGTPVESPRHGRHGTPE